MPPKRNIQPKTQDGKLINHSIVPLTLGKTVLPHRGHGNPAVSTSSSTSPLSIRLTSTSLSNVTPKQVVGNPSNSSPLPMLSAISTMTPSSKKSLHTFHTPPTNGLKSSMSIAVKKRLKFSPESKNGAKKQAFLINFCDCNKVKIKCLKYLKHAANLPINQESQLTFLLNQFQARDVQVSFYKMIDKVGRVASFAFTPMSLQKKN